MDRLRPRIFVVIVAACSALAAGGMSRLPDVSRQSARARENAAPGHGAAEPPRLLQLPEGVVPVAMQFAPPPLEEIAPAQATQVQKRELAAQSLPAVEPPIPEHFPADLPPAWKLPSGGNGFEAALPPQNSVLRAPAPVTLPRAAAAPPLDHALAAVESRATAAVMHAFVVAERGATYTARGEFVRALRTIAQALDAAHGVKTHSESLSAALRALEEGAEFQGRGGALDARLNLENLVLAHHTPVLKNADLRTVTALEAMQHYYAYAQAQFAAAGRGRRAASLALYGLGKLHAVPAGQAPGAGLMNNSQALVYFQAALLVDPQNHLAANELGVLLARYEQWQDARRVLIHSISTYPLPHAWRNLAVVHERLGELDLAERARAEAERTSPSAAVAASAAGPAVRWVTPGEFAATAEPAPGVPLAAPPRQAVQTVRPNDTHWWKPWTWF